MLLYYYCKKYIGFPWIIIMIKLYLYLDTTQALSIYRSSRECTHRTYTHNNNVCLKRLLT